MAELRVHSAGVDLIKTPPQLRIHGVGVDLLQPQPTRELRIHRMGVTVAGPPPNPSGGVYVRVNGQWVKHRIRIRRNGAWV